MADTEEEKKRKEEEKKIKAEEKRIADIRDKTLNIIETAKNSQELHWNNLRTEIEAAKDEFMGRQFKLVWEGLEKLANSNSYPLWMDIILTIAVTAFPVNALVAHVGQKILFSKKLLGLPVEVDRLKRVKFQDRFLNNPKQILSDLKAIERGDPKIWRSYEKWVSIGKLYGPEVVASFRNIIRTAAQMGITPLFNNEQMTNWITKSQKPSTADNTGLPSVAVLKNMGNWINKSLFNDKTVLTNLDLRIKEESNKLLSNEGNILLDPKKKHEKESKEVFFREIEKFINEEAGLTQVPSQTKVSEQENSSQDESFQRFVEACLWCTSYDFSPQLARSDRWSGDKPVYWKLLPFSKAFWDNLIARHYDPFVGDGTKTYKEIGPNSYIAPANLFKPFPNVEGTISGDLPQPDPATRLSFQWSMILAPSLLNENKDAAGILEKYFPA